MKKSEMLRNLADEIDSCEKVMGDKRIVVLDRGWIFAGNLSKDDGDIFTLTDAVNIRKWEKGGFGAVSLGAKSAGCTLDKCASLRFHSNAMIFNCPISEGWKNE
jgi:hypothetical protein